MDVAVGLIWRDATEAPLLVAFLVLPVAVAGFALRRGSRLALVPMGIFVAQVGLWFAYYATDWFSNPGAAAGALMMMIPTMANLVIAAAALEFGPST